MTDVKKFIQARVDDGYYTPDAPILFRSEWQPLFIYGTMKRGFYRHVYIEDKAKYVGTALTRNSGLTMYRYQHKTHVYPVVLPTWTNEEEYGSVHGEIYLVPPATIKTLDFIDSNGIRCNRYFRTFDLTKPGKGPITMAAWCYIGERKYWQMICNLRRLCP